MVFDNVKVNVGSVAVWPFKMAMVTFEADNSSCALFAPDDEKRNEYGIAVARISGGDLSLAADFVDHWGDELADPGKGEFFTDDERALVCEAVKIINPDALPEFQKSAVDAQERA